MSIRGYGTASAAWPAAAARGASAGSRPFLAEELKRSGLTAVCASFVLDFAAYDKPGDARNNFLRWLTAIDAQLERGQEGWVQARSPTQAKRGLEWATQSIGGWCRAMSFLSQLALPSSLLGITKERATVP